MGDDAPSEIDDGPRVVEPATTEQKVEPKVEPQATQQTTTQAKPSTTAIDVKADQGSKRDYSGFDTEQQAHFKQMSKPAFEYFAKQTREFKALQEQKGNDSYYQHPDAYTLTPEYKEVNDNITYMSRERDHWRQQLLNIRNAKPWFGLQGFDDKGNLVTSGPFKPTDEADLEVANVFSVINGKIGEMFGQRTNMQNGFKQRVQQDIDAINKERNLRFEWARDATKLDTKVDVEGIGEVPIKQIREDFRGMWPSYMRSHPLMEVTCDMFAALQSLAAQNRSLMAGVNNEKALKEEVIRAEPNIDGGAQGSGGATAKELVFTDDAP